MKSKKAMAAFLALAAMAMALPAAAQSTAGSRHFYAGGTIGSNNDEEVAMRLLGGYQFTPNIAAEVGYHRLGDMNFSGARATPRAIELLGVGMAPVGPVSLYGKLGLYQGSKTPGGDNTDLTYGFGVLYDLARNLGVRGEVQRYEGLKGVGGNEDVDVLSVGVIYRFN